MSKRKEGFTLVELLIVLAVIAALLAIVTPVAVRAVNKAKATQVASTLRNIAAAAQQYYYTEKQMPGSLDDLKNNGYIQGNTDGYSLTSDSNANTITISYTGGGVSIADVQSVWDEVTGSDDNIQVTVEVSQYW